MPHSLCLTIAITGCNDNNEVHTDDRKPVPVKMCTWVQAHCEQEIPVEYFSWMPFLHVKLIRVEISHVHFPFPNLLLLIPMSMSWVTGPSQKHVYPWITLHPQTLHPIDIPPVHSVISVLTVYILSLASCVSSPPQLNQYELWKAEICTSHFLCLKTQFFPPAKSQISGRV